jgi:two-component system, sensor histidine kinase
MSLRARFTPLKGPFSGSLLRKALRPYRHWSLQHKVALVILLGMLSSLAVSITYFVLLDRGQAKTAMVEELQVLARITAVRSSAALAFADTKSAQENLSALSLRSTLQQACIYTPQQRLFAAYARSPGPFGPCPSHLYNNRLRAEFTDRLTLLEPIVRKQQNLGYVYLVADLSPLQTRLHYWISSGLLVALLALVVAWVMTRRMQNTIVNPIHNLAQVMEQVKHSNDLSLRAQPHSQDEVGRLVDVFNTMLDRLHDDNHALETLYQDLVQKSAQAEATAASLEVSNKHIKDLFSSAAHDLRQPLQAMALFINALRQAQDPATQQDTLNKLHQALHNLHDLFQEILDVSRYDFDLTVMATQPTDLQALTAKLRLEFDALAAQKNLQLRFFVPPYVALAQTALLERIIRNLLSNAIRYTDRGGVLLGCRTRGGQLRIEVWDTGIGIPSRKLEHIFGRFTQVADDGEKRGGYGLGLAIVKQFADSLGYHLSVHSREGKGSVFTLSIPLAPSPSTPLISSSAQRISSTAPLKAPSANPGTGSNPRPTQSAAEPSHACVYLIDDDPSLRQGLAQLVRSWGMQVLEFNGWSQVHAYLAQGTYLEPDLILSDYQLGADPQGDQLILRLRQHLNRPVPACILTGASDDLWDSLQQGPIPCVRKPVKPARLRAILNHLLST